MFRYVKLYMYWYGTSESPVSSDFRFLVDGFGPVVASVVDCETFCRIRIRNSRFWIRIRNSA
jgi:hypothetical protein